MLRRLDAWPLGSAALVGGTAAATVVGLALRVPYALCVLQAAAAWPFFAAAAASGRPGRAVVKTLTFAVVAAALVTAAVAVSARDALAEAVPRGAAYRDEMFPFVYSGGTAGEEASPRQYLPRHALQFGAFCVLASASLGFGALALGAFLLDYMSYYVGSLWIEASTHGGDPFRALLFAWAPYAVVRVIAYACTGAGLTAWILGPPALRPRSVRFVAVGLVLAVADVVLKAVLARWYGATLLGTLHDR